MGGDVEAQKATSSASAAPVGEACYYGHYVSWRDRIKYFSWQWQAIVMATGVTSSLLHNFPYHNDTLALKIVALVIFLIGLLVFVFDCVCIILKGILFPKEFIQLITDPSKSAFSGFLAVGAAGLIDAALAVNRDWGTGHNGFMYALWGFWWLDAGIAYTVAFGVIFFILGHSSHSLNKVVAIWIIPVVALVAVSTCGGLVGNALISHSHTLAILTSVFSLTMCLIGLSFTMMITAAFLLRLFLEGPPEGGSVLATFNTLTPLGQGGYSLLVNGQNLAELIPTRLGPNFPQSQVAGQMLFSVCFCGAYVLWSMGIAWVLVSCFSILRRERELPKFTVTHWCIVFPNGVFALLSLELGVVLDSPFYRGFGAAWSIIVFTMWTVLFFRSIPAFIDGTMFVPPCPIVVGHDKPNPFDASTTSPEKNPRPSPHSNPSLAQSHPGHSHDDGTLYDGEKHNMPSGSSTPPDASSSGSSRTTSQGLLPDDGVTVQNAWPSKMRPGATISHRPSCAPTDSSLSTAIP